MRGFEICSGVLNIKPISSLMKCKYFGESLNWITEREKEWGRRGEGEAGGPDSLFEVFTSQTAETLGDPAPRGGGRGWGRGESTLRRQLEGAAPRTHG